MRTLNNEMATRFTLLTALHLWLVFALPGAMAQTEIPIGAWRLHLSYTNIQAVEVGPETVFAATKSGILTFDRKEKSLDTYDKLTGLSSTGISCIRFDAGRELLIIGYEDGNLDLIGADAVSTFDRLKNAEVTTAKKINHISIHDSFAYMSTAYGVVVFDLEKHEIKETWRDLGVSGARLLVHQSTFLNDSIYLATADGVIAGKLSDNLLDYNNWERFEGGPFSGSTQSIATFNNKVYAASSGLVYRYGGDNNWVPERFPPVSAVQSLTASGANLFMIADSTIWSLNATGGVSEIDHALVTAPAAVAQDDDGNYWIGDHSAGLISNAGGSFSAYLPNGPSFAIASRLVYHDGKMFILGGGATTSGEPLSRKGELNVFENGFWTTLAQPLANLTDIAFSGQQTFLSSFGAGIARTDASGKVDVLDATNSPLMSSDGLASNIAAIENSPEGLWAANYGGIEPLHLLKMDGNWESFSFGLPNEQHPVELCVDGDGSIWVILDAASGGGLVVFNRETNKVEFKTTTAGSGGLPHINVTALSVDKNGYMWVGTDAGVAYFYSPEEDAIKPIYENRFLLRDEKITAIKVDAGNRKWIGTEQGAWLFNSTGESLVHHFTPENSPLLSPVIRDIEINDRTGEVFFATDRGVVSYRGDAIVAEPASDALKIFPNPVYPGYRGIVGISGLSDNAFVRITSVSGKLIARTQANGGMATWNVRDQEGRRVSTGVYLVFASSTDGTESVVGKIAVIE